MSRHNPNDNYPDTTWASDPRMEPDYGMECPKCVEPVEPEWTFCPYCGTNMPEERRAQAEADYWQGE